VGVRRRKTWKNREQRATEAPATRHRRASKAMKRDRSY